MHEVEDAHSRSTQDGDGAPQSPSTFTSHLRQSFAGVQGPHSPGPMRRTRRRHDRTTHAWYRHDFTRMVRGRCAAPAVYRSCSMDHGTGTMRRARSLLVIHHRGRGPARPECCTVQGPQENGAGRANTSVTDLVELSVVAAQPSRLWGGRPLLRVTTRSGFSELFTLNGRGYCRNSSSFRSKPPSVEPKDSGPIRVERFYIRPTS